MLQKFDYVKITYTDGTTKEGYLVDLTDQVGILVEMSTNTAFDLSSVTLEVLHPGSNPVPLDQQTPTHKPYKVIALVGAVIAMQDKFAKETDAVNYARANIGAWTNNVHDGQFHQFSRILVLCNGATVHEFKTTFFHPFPLKASPELQQEYLSQIASQESQDSGPFADPRTPEERVLDEQPYMECSPTCIDPRCPKWDSAHTRRVFDSPGQDEPYNPVLEVTTVFADEPQANSVERFPLKELPRLWQEGFTGIIDNPEFVSLTWTVGLTSVTIKVDENTPIRINYEALDQIGDRVVTCSQCGQVVERVCEYCQQCYDCTDHTVCEVPTEQHTSSPHETLETYYRGKLSFLWAKELNSLRDANPKLSPIRAGELAAAKIAAQAGKEYAELEEKLKFNADEGSPGVNLYDWLVDHEDIKSVLISMSGTRTLIPDMDRFNDTE